jgi:cellobiose transport system permease protein
MAATPQGAIRARRKTPGHGTWSEMRRHFWPYLFISPFFILFAIFGLFPYLYSFFLSFNSWDGISPMKWAGLANYHLLVNDAVWWKSLYNSIWLLIVTSVNLGIALVLAFIINSGLVKLKEVYRTAYFMPIVASSVAMAMVFTSLFGFHYGILNYLLGQVGLGPIDWLGNPSWVKPSIALMVIWRSFGWNTVIYLAGLQSIPGDLYEAARVDGARWKDIFLRITIPLLRPVITFTVILSIIGNLQLFEEPLILCGGTTTSAPGCTDQAGLTVMVNLYNTAFNYVHFGYAAAMSVALFVLIVVFSAVYYRTLGRTAPE